MRSAMSFVGTMPRRASKCISRLLATSALRSTASTS
jgi:hypothetical protein